MTILRIQMLGVTAAAFVAGYFLALAIGRRGRNEDEEDEGLLLVIANRDAVKEVSRAYRQNLKTFEEIRLEVEIGLRSRIDDLKDKLDEIEEALAQQSEVRSTLIIVN